MGAWGAGVFSDDLACDIRDQFRELIGDGKSTEAATKQILVDYDDTLDDEDEGPSFWIALAATQSQCGRLMDRIGDKAVKIIDKGGDLARWKALDGNAKDLAARKAALSKLRKALLGPQRQPTKIRKAYADQTDWKVGHAISYRLKSGNFVIMRVLGIEDMGKSLYPIVELCDWIGREIPSPSRIAKLRRKQTKLYKKPGRPSAFDIHDHKFSVYANSPREFPAERVAVVATRLSVKRTNIVGATFFGGWKALDRYLAENYAVR